MLRALLTLGADHLTCQLPGEQVIHSVGVDAEVMSDCLFSVVELRHFGLQVALFLQLAQQVEQELISVVLLERTEQLVSKALDSHSIDYRHIVLLFDDLHSYILGTTVYRKLS